MPRTASGGTQADPLLIDDDEDDEEDGNQEVADSSQGHSDREYQYQFYGVLATKIVGVRYYTGYTTEGELATLRREPHNPYDSTCR